MSTHDFLPGHVDGSAHMMAPPIVRAPSFESLFDPVELLGTSIPFVDPFSYDVRKFYDSGSDGSERPPTEKTLGRAEKPAKKRKADTMVPAEAPNCQLQLRRHMPLHNVYATSQFSYSQLPVSFESMHPRQAILGLRPHLPALLSQEPRRTPQIVPDVSTLGPVTVLDSAGSGSGLLNERIRLTPDQAVHIFLLGRNKTAGTAAELASKYGISAKAIRDIWTKKSWAQETRTHWTD